MPSWPDISCITMPPYARAAQRFGISKSTVHKDVTERLRLTNHQLYEQVKAVLEENKAERHIRGGMATKRKYKEHQN